MQKVIFFILVFICYNSISQVLTFLPKPTGNYIIGTTEFSITDSTRKEKLTFNRNDFRKISLKIWYPSDDSQNKKQSYYLDKYSTSDIYNAYKAFSEDSSYFDKLKQYKTNSYKDISVSSKQEKFPVLIFSPGFYFGLDDFYSSFMENLASNGYIVISISHPYDQQITYLSENEKIELKKNRAIIAYSQWKIVAFFKTKKPDSENKKKVNRMLSSYLRRMNKFNKILDLWVKDSEFVLNLISDNESCKSIEFIKNKIDLSRIGAFGQSFGGAVAGELLFKNERIKAACNLDGFQFGSIYNNKLEKPVLLMHSDTYYDWIIGNKCIYKNTKPFYFHLIKNSKHFIFSDCPIFPENSNKIYSLTGTKDGKKIINYFNKLILDFFNKYMLEYQDITINKPFDKFN